jgi:hypothetical protein
MEKPVFYHPIYIRYLYLCKAIFPALIKLNCLSEVIMHKMRVALFIVFGSLGICVVAVIFGRYPDSKSVKTLDWAPSKGQLPSELPKSLVFSASSTGSAQNVDAKVKAEEILNQARDAISDKSKLNQLKTLSLSGTTLRIVGERKTEFETEYEMVFPDKFKRAELHKFGTTTLILNGIQVWQDYTPTTGVGTGIGRSLIPLIIGDPIDPTKRAQHHAKLSNNFTLLLMGLLITSPSSIPLDFTYLGEAKSPYGAAHAILAKGTGDFKMSIYFEKHSYRLLMLYYKDKQHSQIVRRRSDGSQAEQGSNDKEGRKINRAELEYHRKEMEERVANLPEVEFRWVFSEYKNIDGINLPHRLTKFEADKPYEEFEISKYKLNPKLSADGFVNKKIH